MLRPHQRVLVACSGGPDSVALLHLLKHLAKGLHIQVFAFHLHHGLRGRSADEDANFVQSLCQKWRIPLALRYEDVKQRAREQKKSLEEAGREARYQHLLQVADKWNIHQIALGHTASDNLETFLMRLVQGASREFLKGIPPVRSIKTPQGREVLLIRPLIALPREAILHHCRAHRLPYRIDPSNSDLRFLRNRIRHRLIPYLNRTLNPGWQKKMLEIISLLNEEDEFIQKQAQKISKRYISGNRLSLSFLRQPYPIQRRVFLLWLQILKVPFHGKTLRKLLQACQSLPERKIWQLSAKWWLMKEGKSLHILPQPEKVQPILLQVPGKVGDYTCTILSPAPHLHLKIQKAKPWEAFLDAGCIRGKIRVRGWKPGDRFYPLGMNAPKKLQDFFVDEKIPSLYRSSVPIITDDEKILWIVGHRLDDRVKVTNQTRKILHLLYHGKGNDEQPAGE